MEGDGVGHTGNPRGEVPYECLQGRGGCRDPSRWRISCAIRNISPGETCGVANKRRPEEAHFEMERAGILPAAARAGECADWDGKRKLVRGFAQKTTEWGQFNNGNGRRKVQCSGHSSPPSLRIFLSASRIVSHSVTEGDLQGTPVSFSPSVPRRRCPQVGQDVLRQDAAVLRSAPRIIRTMCAQKPAAFPGIARDVLAHLQLHPGKPRLFFQKHFKPVGAGAGDHRARRVFPGHFIPAPFFNEGSARVGI